VSFEFVSEKPVSIVLPARLSFEFVRERQDLIFVYSNDMHNRGMEGMAFFFVGNKNAFMVPTMKKMCKSATDKYFRDGQNWILELISRHISDIPRDGRPIIPVRGIGKGCSMLREYAPETFKFLWDKLNEISAKNIEWKTTS
jgi:hypothetical protein